MDRTFDIAIVGAGISGASLAYALAGRASVVLLERESQPGYHSTGRSAAAFLQTYGNDVIRRLTAASAEFLFRPPPGFSEAPLLLPRPGMTVASADKADLMASAYERAKALVPEVRLLSPDEAREIVPLLRPEAVAGGAMLEPGAQDMEVASLHQGYLKGARASGAALITNAEVLALARRDGRWRLETKQGEVAASVLVNAAGAWADAFAAQLQLAPLGLQPKRRTAFTFAPPPEFQVAAWPMVIEVGESFYFKPDAGLLLGSPADETPCPPCDAQPEELDLAIGAHRIEEATGHPIKRLLHSWAGLRTFAPDMSPVLGFDPRAEDFFWLAGQGGYGIMISPAMAAAAAALLAGGALPETLQALGLDPAGLSPARFL